MGLIFCLISALSFLCLNTLSAQETIIRGFTDVDFAASDEPSEHTSFSLGQYDLYMTSELSDRLSFLGEIVFEFDQDFVVDVERVQIEYEWDNYFNVSVGKHHTPIGYWNTAYHHGTLLQPTIQRPLLFRFEDEDGILPIHTTGIRFWGANIGTLRFGYDLMIGNGIGSTAATDNNDAKSVTLSIHSKPTDGLQLGVSGYWDRIAAGTISLQKTALASALRQQILTGTVIYARRPFELMAELVHVTNNADLTGTTTTDGYYIYGGYRFGKTVPYFRFDQIFYDTGEQYYIDNDARLLVVGLRHDLNFMATIKLEFHHAETETGGTSKGLNVQAAVGF